MTATTETTLSAECRIYVACLASYNSGCLHGRWIDCDGKDADELQDEVNAMLRASPYPNVEVDCPTCEDVDSAGCATCKGRGKVPSAEEFAIHDHEGFEGLLEEYSSLDDVAALAEILSEGEASSLGLVWLIKDVGYSLSDACDKAADVSIYQDESAGHEERLLTSYAEELVDDCYSEAVEGLPDLIRYHIDYEGIGRDLRIGGDVAVARVAGELFLVTNASEF